MKNKLSIELKVKLDKITLTSSLSDLDVLIDNVTVLTNKEKGWTSKVLVEPPKGIILDVSESAN